ncbi:hypothetical protein [Pseudoalteromonas piscicida]|uniref:hypothetical protein n=1 Tax=Pseudoalteromonas piscicida TaxID=43662 RepID=UPI0005FA34F7|nr:hypothetical protein [Pseudoalteromonas piscicida]KJY96741.1 hypothetical protein TW73_16020 [Pseudoalteromonas piscicida]
MMVRKLLSGVAFCCISAITNANPVHVGGVIYQLDFSDFTPITKSYGSTTAVVGYEKELFVEGDYGQSLLYEVDGEIKTKWFAGNMLASMFVSCSDATNDPSSEQIIGATFAFGVRYDQVSYTAKPRVSEIRNTAGQCKRMKIRINKEGNLSRQFYTIYTDMKLRVKVIEVVGG